MLRGCAEKTVIVDRRVELSRFGQAHACPEQHLLNAEAPQQKFRVAPKSSCVTTKNRSQTGVTSMLGPNSDQRFGRCADSGSQLIRAESFTNGPLYECMHAHG